MNNSQRSRMAALLGLCALVLSAEPARVETASPAGVINPLAAPSLDRLSATRERPLFTPSRRAAPPPPPVASPAPIESVAALPQIALVGVVISVQGPRAVINDMALNKIVRVRIGDEIDGWIVRQIEERLLVLSRDGRSTSYKLFSGDHAKPAPQTVNAANKPTEPGLRQAHRPRSE
jgi:type II secretory pathway component PulC